MKNFFKENWFKFGVLITLLIIAATISYNFVLLIPQEKQLNIASSEGKIIVQNQDNCSKQAEVFFGKIETQGDTYANHYNNKLDKCFILISTILSVSNGNVIVAKSLYNATENSHYAGFYKTIFAGVADENSKVQNCWYLDKYCQSEQEFDNFVGPFMTN